MKGWALAPVSSNQKANGSVLGVSLADGERIEWVYTILA